MPKTRGVATARTLPAPSTGHELRTSFVEPASLKSLAVPLTEIVPVAFAAHVSLQRNGSEIALPIRRIGPPARRRDRVGARWSAEVPRTPARPPAPGTRPAGVAVPGVAGVPGGVAAGAPTVMCRLTTAPTLPTPVESARPAPATPVPEGSSTARIRPLPPTSSAPTFDKPVAAEASWIRTTDDRAPPADRNAVHRGARS